MCTLAQQRKVARIAMPLRDGTGVKECDATGDAIKYKRRAQKIFITKHLNRPEYPFYNKCIGKCLQNLILQFDVFQQNALSFVLI